MDVDGVRTHVQEISATVGRLAELVPVLVLGVDAQDSTAREPARRILLSVRYVQTLRYILAYICLQFVFINAPVKMPAPITMFELHYTYSAAIPSRIRIVQGHKALLPWEFIHSPIPLGKIFETVMRVPTHNPRPSIRHD